MKKRHRKKKKVKSETDTRLFNGLLLIACSLILFLSLLSFANGAEKHHILGLMGETVGWAFFAVFGLSSYVITFYLGWLGWRLIFGKNNQPTHT